MHSSIARHTTFSHDAYSVDTIMRRLCADIGRLNAQRALLAENLAAPGRTDTLAMYDDMLDKRRQLLETLEAERQRAGAA